MATESQRLFPDRAATGSGAAHVRDDAPRPATAPYNAGYGARPMPGTPESSALYAKVCTAIERCERLNRLAYEDADAVRAAWSELTGQAVDESFRLIPPVRSDHGLNIRVGREVFINHGCTLNDIGDQVMLGGGSSIENLTR